MTDIDGAAALAGTIVDEYAVDDAAPQAEGAAPAADAEVDADEADKVEAAEAAPDTEPEGEADEPEAVGDVEGEADEADEPEGEALPLPSVVEALLFAAREPLKAQNLARAAGRGTRADAVREAVAELNVHYLETGRAFEIAEISGRYQLMSRPEYAARISRLYPKKPADADKAGRLTPPALETLAVIAYKQPATRAEVERIRGCGCGPALRSLVERGSVRVAGKRTDVVGQPLLYATTEAFLAEFGLGSLDELPLRSEFMGLAAAPIGQDGLDAPRVLDIVSQPESADAPQGTDAPQAGDAPPPQAAESPQAAEPPDRLDVPQAESEPAPAE